MVGMKREAVILKVGLAELKSRRSTLSQRQRGAARQFAVLGPVTGLVPWCASLELEPGAVRVECRKGRTWLQ